MRGVLGLAMLIIGFSMAWLIIIGKFPPSTEGQGFLGQLGNAIAGNGGSSTSSSGTSTSTTSGGGGTGPRPL